MSVKRAVAEEAVLKALLDAIDAEYKAKRAEVQALLEEAKSETGLTSVAAQLPDGTVVAKVSVTGDPQPEARVVDEKAFLAWVRQVHPQQVHSRLVVTVREAFEKSLLAEMTAAGVARWVDRETGELHDVPGVELKPTRSSTHSVRFEKTGRDAIADAWRTGRLAVPGLQAPELPAAG